MTRSKSATLKVSTKVNETPQPSRKRTLAEMGSPLKDQEPAHKRFQHLLETPVQRNDIDKENVVDKQLNAVPFPQQDIDSDFEQEETIQPQDECKDIKETDLEATEKESEESFVHKDPAFVGITPFNSPATTPKTLKTISPAMHKRVKSTPAFQKYKHLVDDLDENKVSDHVLALPEKHVTLEKMFYALETCVLFSKARDQPAIFHRIKKSVENICHR